MSVSPLEYRYGREKIKNIFSEKSRLEYMLRVEGVIARFQGELGIIPVEAAQLISKSVTGGRVSLARVKEIEKSTKHDVMAIVNALTEVSGDGGSFVHYGITSQDVNDTATALQLRDFNRYFREDIIDMVITLSSLVARYKDTPMVGRTHGQHASPITFGLKLAVFLAEMIRHLERLDESSRRVLVAKVMGPVGTGASLGTKALQLQKKVADNLSLGIEEAATQVVLRDRYVEFLQVLANIAASLEKFSTEIRNLQRPEIGEVSEHFTEQSQVGSSAMPSKVNPVDSENVSSLARFIRTLVTPELEAAVMWHERDLANSALERFTIPYSCILSDHILDKMNGIFASIMVDDRRMLKNLLDDDFCMSESVVLLLVKNGFGRQQAHEAVRKASVEARKAGSGLKQYILSSSVFSMIPRNDIDVAFDPRGFLGSARIICENVIKMASNVTETARRVGTSGY
ncbi:MAG: adenylosuccinate lyase [Candidatus Thermoplasmatota archaeon]|jgi:adenylosuccinate lyase|nr:adenylosuccinate lyase [Candidatus Thermoplasmatota archaeon]MCL5785636.1 adenylosuccinate lyase [Candidatus Thermoplasmatota archaeon]